MLCIVHVHVAYCLTCLYMNIHVHSCVKYNTHFVSCGKNYYTCILLCMQQHSDYVVTNKKNMYMYMSLNNLANEHVIGNTLTRYGSLSIRLQVVRQERAVSGWPLLLGRVESAVRSRVDRRSKCRECEKEANTAKYRYTHNPKAGKVTAIVVCVQRYEINRARSRAQGPSILIYCCMRVTYFSSVFHLQCYLNLELKCCRQFVHS